MITQILITSFALVFVPQSIPREALSTTLVTPVSESLILAQETLQKEITLDPLDSLKRSLLESYKENPQNKTLNEKQNQKVDDVKVQIKKYAEANEFDKAFLLETKLFPLLEAYGAPVNREEINLISKEDKNISSSTVLLLQKQVNNHLGETRKQFLSQVEKMNEQDIEKVEYDLMLVEQMITFVHPQDTKAALITVQTIEKNLFESELFLTKVQ